ncbi:hypothetical protein B9J77_05250 [candidate division NPL-UPA2 bacterium Unc8]|uniref:Uncharacterized protein n=1 Tax=candidate division NPL-UPA2 bacterium Unc8 TaxID=1980939 RepID=A0A399FWC6_UNCN2|nr:MAG: hypothetical protein B9J77_05250 [candidate division NPL-UPA2 bacterium Unc8]
MIESLRISSVSQRVNIDKLLATVAFIFIATALFVVATTPPATGYEISIYDAYPSYFWFFIIAAIACGIIILVRQAFAQKPSRWWIAGFSVILFTNLVILLLPFARGYLTWGRGDVLTHIGYTKHILFTGHFASAGEAGANHYPVIHILGANLSLITGLTPELLAMLVPGFFTLFYMVSICLLSKRIASCRGQALLTTAFGSLLLFGLGNLMVAPSIQCFHMLPFVLFLLYKAAISANRAAYSLLLALVLLLIPFLHPGEGSIFFILILLCLGFSLWCYRRIKKPLEKAGSTVSAPQSISFINPSLILFVTWFAWFAAFPLLAGIIKYVWDRVVYQMGPTAAMEVADTLAKANLSLFEFTELFSKMWGHVAIYCLVAAMISILVGKRFLSSTGKTDSSQFTFSFLFIIFGILMFVAFSTGAIWVAFNRVMLYVIFAATILSGLGLYVLFRNWHRRIGMVITTFLLIAAATIGVFNTFPSPIVRANSAQVTRMEMSGMQWFFAHRDEALLIDHILLNPLRFDDALQGVQGRLLHIQKVDVPERHFGYPQKEMYGESFAEGRYLVDSKISRVSPLIFPEFVDLLAFRPQDFYRLDNEDPSVSKVYSSGEFWVYIVRGMGTLSP